MGKIKKILENELVGGTHSTDVYPVTSDLAVYDSQNGQLRDYLTTIINGYIYYGVATPSTSPKQAVKAIYYLVQTEGIYTNFNNIEVLDGEIALLMKPAGISSEWTKVVLDVARLDTIKSMQSDINLISRAKTYYGTGYMNIQGAFNPESTGPYVVTDFIPINEGTYIRYRLYRPSGLSSNAAVWVVFDSEKTFTYTRESLALYTEGEEVTKEFTISTSSKNAAYIRFCGPKDSFYIEEIRVALSTSGIESDISALKSSVDKNSTDITNLSSSIKSIDTDINTLSGKIDSNTASIETNTEIIRQNESRFGEFEESASADLSLIKSEQTVISNKLTNQEAELQSTKTELDNKISAQKAEIDAAKDDAIQSIQEQEQSSIQNFNKEKVTPEMLSESTKQYIESSGGGSVTNLADNEDIVSVDNLLKFNDRLSSPLNFSGKGYKILRKNIQDGKNILSSQDINLENTVYIIKYDFDLNNAALNIPDNSILVFEGGSLSNGIIYLGNSIIHAPLYSIFNNVFVYDKLLNTNNVKTNHVLYVEWFGAKGDGETDDTIAIQNCCSCGAGVIIFQSKNYYITNTIEIQCLRILANNATIVSNIPEKFALVLEGIGSNTSGFSTLEGGLSLLNKNLNISEIDSQQTFIGTTIAYSSVEAINTASVTYQDFTVDGASIGDMVFVSTDNEVQLGFCKFSGEVISDNTVRIYANNFWFATFTIEDTPINIKILHNVCHGLNMSGSVQAFSQIRVIQYTGLSCGMGSGLDIESGIRYPGSNKVYYTHLELNVFPAGGIGFSCCGRNNCNTFKITSFSSPYSTASNWAKTYPYHAVISSGINNVYELLSLEGTYHKEALVSFGTGNICNSVYCELVKNDAYPSTNESVKSYKYGASNKFRFVFNNGLMEPGKIEGPNCIIRVPQSYVNGGMRKQNANVSCNLLKNFSFRYDNFGWQNYSTGSNGTFTFVNGPLENSKAARLYTENGRIILSQSIPVNDLPIKDFIITISAWVRGACIIFVNNRGTNMTNSSDYKSDEWHYVESKIYMMDAPINNAITVQFRSPDNYSGYIEVYNPCVSIGESTTGIDSIDKTVYPLNSQGILFNSGNAIKPNETYTQDIIIDWIKQESMVNFTWKVSDKISFLEKFKLEYIVSDGYIRLYLTNITSSNQYSGRVYPYIQYLG